MLSKKFNETDVKMMFAPFGNIEDCTVLRDQNGQSRGMFAIFAQWTCPALILELSIVVFRDVRMKVYFMELGKFACLCRMVLLY